MQSHLPNLHLLNVFLAVVEAGGFRAAQSSLGCRLPTISANIKKLEQSLGCTLCRRGRAGLALTDEGETVHKAAQDLLSQVNEYNRMASRIRAKGSNSISICTCDEVISNSSFKLQESLKEFLLERPDVPISLDTLPPTMVEQAVMKEEYQLGITSSFRMIEGLVYEKMFSETQVLVCSRTHPEFQNDFNEATVEELRHLNRVQRSYLTSPGLRAIPNVGTHNGSANSMEATAILVLSGHFLGYLPDHMAQPYIDSGKLIEILPDVARYDSDFYLIFKKNMVTRQIHRLVNLVLKEC